MMFACESPAFDLHPCLHGCATDNADTVMGGKDGHASSMTALRQRADDRVHRQGKDKASKRSTATRMVAVPITQLITPGGGSIARTNVNAVTADG